MASDRLPPRFYVLLPGRGSGSDTEFFKAEPIVRGEAPRCSSCGRFLGMRRWLAPRHAQIVVHGDAAGDFAFASSSEFLVSESAISAMGNDELTGLANFEEVEISSTLRAEPATPRRYFHVEIAQQQADLDSRRSDVERMTKPECIDCLSDGIAAIRGFLIDPATWTGADLFVPRGLPGVVVVSEAFRQVAMAHEFSNIELVPTERFTWVPSDAS